MQKAELISPAVQCHRLRSLQQHSAVAILQKASLTDP